jgi:hypothetical protein
MPGIGVGVAVGVMVGVTVGVELGVMVAVGVSVTVGLGVIVGPRNCPGPQLETSRLIITRINECQGILWIMVTSSFLLMEND